MSAKKLITAKEVTAQLTKDDVLNILSSMGYKVNTKTYMFKLRDEKTGSAKINDDCSIHDFGSAFHDDVIKLLETYNSMGFIEAFKTVKNYLGIDGNTIVKPRETIERKKVVYQDEKASPATINYITKYIKKLDAKKTLQTFNNPDYKKEALALSPLWLWSEASKDDLNYFKKLTSFDALNKTIIIKIFNSTGELISFKRRRFNGVKWITAKGTKPNKTTIIRILNNEDPIYIIEGHHDALTAILLGINFIMISTSSYRLFNENELQVISSRDVVFLPDLQLDKEDPSIETMHLLANQIVEISNNVFVGSFVQVVEANNISHDLKKIDLSDLVSIWDKDLISLKDNLFAYARWGLDG